MTVRYKKKKAQLHLRSGNPWQHAASSRKTWPPHAEGVPHIWTALRHVSGGANENLFASPLRNHFHIKFFVDLLSFRLASGYNTMLHKGERERYRERQSKRESTSTHRSQRPPPPSQSHLRHTERERQHPPPPTKKRSESFAARSWAWAQARVVREGRFRGPAGAGPAETRGQRWARPSRGQTCSCGCRCGDQAGNYRGRFYVRRSSGSWGWAETATGSGCCHSCWGLMSPLQRKEERERWSS